MLGAPRWEKSRGDEGFANRKKIRCSTLESLAGREKMRREGPTGGSGRRPCSTMCGVAAEGDPMAGT
jgi:hypothetical protein